jgi:predicted nucleotidyltransferase
MTEERSGYAKPHNQFLQSLLRSPLVALAVAWTFQGLLYMDATERWFKIALDILLTALLGILLSVWFHWYVAWLVALVIAHSLNFLFNAQLWGLLKHFNLVRTSRTEFDEYLERLSERIRAEPSIQWAAAYGSLVRGEWKETSDLDVRLVRKPGLWNGLRACWFSLSERTRALVSKFPLDLFVLDDPGMLTLMRDDEPPLDLLAPGGSAQGSRKP